MHKFFTSSFDASVYLQQPEQNAGRDEILEVGKLYYGSTKDIARSLIKFDVANMGIPSGSKVYLNLKCVQAEEIPLEYIIHANAISQSWTMGTGTKFDNITSDGVSWKYRNGVDSWQDNTTGGTANYVGSGATGSANAEGGTWYTGSEASQSYNYEEADIRMDVTDIINVWLSGSLPNNGLILHHSLTNEENVLDYGIIKFFSKETNTIYEPKLEVVWDDSSFITGSLVATTGSAEDGYKIVLNNLKNKYPANETIKVRVKGRDMYPLKSFGTTFEYDHTKYLPSGSVYYQLEDYRTGEVVYPFGNYTKVSCDSTSNYFNMSLNTLPINRTYKLKIKVVEDGISTIIDDKLIFEII
jgi:hypothetical protein